MNYSNFLYMREEISLIVLMVVLFLYDLFAGKKALNFFQPVACVLFAIHTALLLLPRGVGEAFGGMYQFNEINIFVKSILNIGTLIVFLLSSNWLKSEGTVHKRGEFFFLTLSTLLGMYFMLSAGNFLMYFIGLETASIPMACLIAFDKYKKVSAEAGAKYILSAAFASGLSLYGISLIYGSVGTLYFNDVPAGITGDPLQIMAFGFFVVGLLFKISLVPFHQWAPDSYEGAPTTVTAYLSVVSKASGAFVLLTLLYKVFGGLMDQWQAILFATIALSITVANLFAIRQKNLKRFLAYSSISQAGYIMLGAIGGTALGMTSLVYFLLVYLFSNLAAFAVISIVEHRSGKINISDYNGFYQTNPRLSVVMTFALFSLAGIPPFAGFFSKFFVFAAAVDKEFYVLVFIALINTVISLYYYLLVVKAMFINPNDAPIASFRSDNYTRLALIITTAGILVLGVASNIYEYISSISYGM
ncbi:MAG: NADH-quinone oxidoreductase subunit N [Bacteroidales bacterium]|nr:NADH-quinone oxidoreductase subunit N [Bacteroidales bacterium]